VVNPVQEIEMKSWIIGSLSVLAWSMLGSIATAEPTRICQYDPDLGVPNPLGMRTYITITEEDGNTTFLFEQFPSNLGLDIPATIASSRQLTMYGVDADQARQIMLQEPAYYSELVGYSDSEGFAQVNQVLTCR
jgi:hypothetical protein